jgi:hypothetical protein
VPTGTATPGGIPAPPSGKQSQPTNALGAEWSVDQEATILTLDQIQPGTADSYKLMQAQILKDPTAVVKAISRYKVVYQRWLAEQAQAGAISKANLATAQSDLTALKTGDAIASGVQAVPLLGQILGGVWQIARAFVQLDADAKAQGRSLYGATVTPGTPIFSGFRDGDFWFFDVPVLSLTAPIFAANFPNRSSWIASLTAFVALCSAQPLGYPVSPITIQLDGGFVYSFTNQGERAIEVWNPLDITSTGPRGFDPKNPRAWKIPGQNQSVFDHPWVHVT